MRSQHDILHEIATLISELGECDTSDEVILSDAAKKAIDEYVTWMRAGGHVCGNYLRVVAADEEE